MQISQAGINLIKEFEDLKTEPYLCPAGRLTIGYGHVILSNEHFTEITEETAKTLLEKDILIAENCINKHVTAPINQNQFDALCDFVFNLGIGDFERSTLLKLLNEGNYEAAANEFLKWDHCSGKVLRGLAERRKAEEELFLS